MGRHMDIIHGKSESPLTVFSYFLHVSVNYLFFLVPFSSKLDLTGKFKGEESLTDVDKELISLTY